MTILESLKAAKSCTDVLNLLRAGGDSVRLVNDWPYNVVSFGLDDIDLKPLNDSMSVLFWENYYSGNLELFLSGRRDEFEISLDGYEELNAFIKGIKPAKRITA